MPTLTPQHPKHRRPKDPPITTSDQTPRTQSPSQSSTPKTTNISTVCLSTYSKHGTSKETEKLLAKKLENKKIFVPFGLKVVGCGPSSPASSTDIVREAADWDAQRVRTNKNYRKKKQSKMTSPGSKIPAVVVVDVHDVCCGPVVGIASDVVAAHRTRSCQARGTIASTQRVVTPDQTSAFDANRARSDASNERQMNRLRRRQCSRSPGSLPQVWDSLVLDGYNEFRNWRLDVDSMSYEQLLDLSEMMGYVGTGLREDEISRCLRKPKHSVQDSLPVLNSTRKNWKCSICQEGCKADNKTARLDCGHYHHLNCIKHWLSLKNACPVCRTAAVAYK